MSATFCSLVDGSVSSCIVPLLFPASAGLSWRSRRRHGASGARRSHAGSHLHGSRAPRVQNRRSPESARGHFCRCELWSTASSSHLQNGNGNLRKTPVERIVVRIKSVDVNCGRNNRSSHLQILPRGTSRSWRDDARKGVKSSREASRGPSHGSRVPQAGMAAVRPTRSGIAFATPNA